MLEEPNFKLNPMKTKSIFILIFLAIITSVSVNGQNSEFSGEWNMDKEKSTVSEELFLSRVTIQLKNDTLLTTRVYANGYGEEYPFDENLSLDGKDCSIYIYDMPRTSKASRSTSDGSLSIESKTTFYGDSGEEDLIAKEIWKVDNAGKVLTINYTNKMSGGETTGTSYYNKTK